MKNYQLLLACLGLTSGLLTSFQVRAEEKPLSVEIQEMKKELEALRKDKATSKPMASSNVDKAIDNKYGPNAGVTTKEGKLVVGGLVQVWYQHIQNDNHGAFYAPKAYPGVSNLPAGAAWTNLTPITRTYIGGQAIGAQNLGLPAGTVFNGKGYIVPAGSTITGGGTDEAVDAGDNDTYRIRRAELMFTMDIHENVQARVMIDPANEVNYSQSFAHAGAAFKGTTSAPALGGTATNANALLQDAYIKIHKLIPHHESQTGQFKPPVGEEGFKPNGELDFVERSWVGQKTTSRDLGSMIRGFWWDDRFQYWAGVFDGGNDFHGTRGASAQNRGDTNDEKDFVYRLLVRPVWKNETWGSLELGFSHQFGIHGESITDDLGRNNATTSPISPLSPGGAGGMTANNNNAFPASSAQYPKTNAYRMAAWFNYKPGSVVRGWWIKGEWAMFHDVPAERSVATPFISPDSTISPAYFPGNSGTGTYNGRNTPVTYVNGLPVYYENQTVAPLTTQGFYLATGYKLADSRWKDCNLPFWMKPMEFTYRFDRANNVILQDQYYPQRHLNTFYTNTHTIGLNYYVKGNNAKFQLNYNIVKDPTATYFVSDGSSPAMAPEGTHYKMRGINNNSLVANFQVMW